MFKGVRGLIILITMSLVTIVISAFLCVYVFHLPPTVGQIICGVIGMVCGAVCIGYCFFGDPL
jgi:hypothetical protein